MWPFRRSSVPSTPPSDGVVVHRAMRTDWQRTAPMPIVQARTFGAVDGGFEQILTTRRQPTFLGPLGHELSPSAPRGVVSGLARAAPDVVTGGVVQRAFAAPRHGWAPSDTSSELVADVDDEPSSTFGADSIADTAVPSVEIGSTRPTEPPRPSGATLPLATQRAAIDRPSEHSAAPFTTASPPEVDAAPGRSAPPSSMAGPALSFPSATTPDVIPIRPSPNEPPADESRTIPATQRTPLKAEGTVAGPAANAFTTPAPTPPIQRATQSVGASNSAPAPPSSVAGPARPLPSATTPDVIPIRPSPNEPPADESRTIPLATQRTPLKAEGTVAGPAPNAFTTPAPTPTIQRAQQSAGASNPAPAPAATRDRSSAIPAEPSVMDPVVDGVDVAALPVGELAPPPSSGATPTVVPTVGATPAIGTSGDAERPLAPQSAVTTSARTFAVQRRTRIGSPLDHESHPSAAPSTGPSGTARPTTPDVVPSGAGVGLVVSRTIDASPPVNVASDDHPLGEGAGTAWNSDDHSSGVWTHTSRVSDAAPGHPAASLALLAARPLVTTTASRAIDDRQPSTVPVAGTIQRSPAGAALAGSSATVPTSARHETLPLSTPSTVGASARAVQRSTIEGTGGHASRSAQMPSVSPLQSPPSDLGGGGSVIDFGGFQPAADGTLWAADTVAIQRAGDDAADVTPPSAPPSTGTSVVATPSAGPAALTGAPPSDTQIQELCRALYAPLHRRLCRDLLVDRERSGYRTDIRF